MKKLMAVLLSSILLVNVVNAEELDNTIPTPSNDNSNINNEGNNNTSNDVQDDTTSDDQTDDTTTDEKESEYKWSAVQPQSTTTSEGITYTQDFLGRVKDDKNNSYYSFSLVYTIPEDYEEETIIINPNIFEVVGWAQGIEENSAAYILPGDTLKINVKIINNSKYNYNYDENSFVIYPYSTEDMETMEFKKISEDVKTFNDEEITEMQQYIRTENKALKSLNIKVKGNKKYSNENIDAALKEKNYKGIEELDKYYLDFFNDYYGYGQNGKEKVTKLSDFTPEEIGNGIFGGVTTKYYEDNMVLTALHFDFLWNYAMGISLEDEEINDKNQNEYNSGNYMREESKGDEVIKESIGKLESKKESDIDANFHFSGPLLGNAYQGYKIAGHTHLSYTAEKGNVIAKYVDTEGNVLAEDVKTTGMVNKEYKTTAKEFDLYELIKVEGNETGVYTTDDITITYIYEFIGGTGGDDVDIDPDFPKTGVEDNNLPEVIFSLSSLLLATTIILKKRFN